MNYKLCKDEQYYTIPAQNLITFALYQAMYWGYNKPIRSEEDAVIFFKSKGFDIGKEEKVCIR